ncbi:hypothetical protein [Halorussus litoreus]|uniref:hypothetical protein n=1 Tax=Halorussus litoreus TaxID=1710536 RepID=UPI000E271B48|nr:hypothetical protein [Halorussus litoreus]
MSETQVRSPWTQQTYEKFVGEYGIPERWLMIAGAGNMAQIVTAGPVGDAVRQTLDELSYDWEIQKTPPRKLGIPALVFQISKGGDHG